MQIERHAGASNGVSQLMSHPASQLVERPELLLSTHAGLIANQPFGQLIHGSSQVAQFVIPLWQGKRIMLPRRDPVDLIAKPRNGLGDSQSKPTANKHDSGDRREPDSQRRHDGVAPSALKSGFGIKRVQDQNSAAVDRPSQPERCMKMRLVVEPRG
jgi:hypothetical protein